VELRNGDLITSKVVLSSLDARTTFLGLVGEEYLPSPFVHAIKEIQYENGYVQIHLTLKEMPEYTGDLAFVNENDIRWLMAYIPSPDHLARCWEQYRRGQVPEDPVDPSLAPEGRYTCTFFSHYFPYAIPQKSHNELKKLMADRMIDQMAKHAPNLRDAIVDEVILTHQYFEKTFGISGGDFCHGLLHPGQMWDRRGRTTGLRSRTSSCAARLAIRDPGSRVCRATMAPRKCSGPGRAETRGGISSRG
jgi:phytoene dehydrogenase-like protein